MNVPGRDSASASARGFQSTNPTALNLPSISPLSLLPSPRIPFPRFSGYSNPFPQKSQNGGNLPMN